MYLSRWVIYLYFLLGRVIIFYYASWSIGANWEAVRMAYRTVSERRTEQRKAYRTVSEHYIGRVSDLRR
jgi:hypothetical protein